MLILFVATSGSGGSSTPPSLPDIHMQDSENLSHIPIGGVEGWDNDFLQAQTICYAPMDFQDQEAGKNAGEDSTMYWCRRLSKGVVRVNFSASGASTVLRPIFEDKDGLQAIGEQITVSATSRQDGSSYMGGVAVFDLLGANKFGVFIESITSGTIDISLAGV